MNFEEIKKMYKNKEIDYEEYERISMERFYFLDNWLKEKIHYSDWYGYDIENHSLGIILIKEIFTFGESKKKQDEIREISKTFEIHSYDKKWSEI